jgi:hypothetical protein
MGSASMATDPACEIRISNMLPDAISNEKFRCQEKLFSQKGFDWTGRHKKFLAAR